MLLNQECNFLRRHRRKLQVNYKQFIATVSVYSYTVTFHFQELFKWAAYFHTGENEIENEEYGSKTRKKKQSSWKKDSYVINN